MLYRSLSSTSWWTALSVLFCLVATDAVLARQRAPQELAEVTGEVMVVVEDDFAAGRARMVYLLEERSSGKIYTLRLGQANHAGRLRGGASVIARGMVRGDEIIVSSEFGGIEMLNGGIDVGEANAAAAVSRDTLVLLVDFQDAAVPCPDSQVADIMFSGSNSVDGLYQETSFGQVSFPGDTDGNGQPNVFRISIDATTTESCNPGAWATAADTAAQDAGIELGLYRHRVYVLPTSAECSWAGVGNLGCGSVCRAWVRTCHLPDVYAHELGHNLGMHHSATDPDNDGSFDCDYCDTSDFMGFGGQGWRQVNGPHKDQMGWLPTEQAVVVQDQGDQTLVISPLETHPALALYPQVLKIFKPANNTYYYLSYRVGTGYDGTLHADYVDKTSVHTYSGSGAGRTLFVAALDDGQEFHAAQDGLTVTQVAHDATSATLLVTVNGSCSLGSPTIDLTPSSQLGQPADVLIYSLTVANQDGSGCGPAIFDLAANPPTGWVATLSSSSLTLAPGEQGTVEVSVASPANAAGGSYSFGVTVSGGSETAHNGSVEATYVVEVVVSGPEPVTDLRGSVKRNTDVSLRWSATTGAESFRIFRDDQSIGQTTQTRYVDRSGSVGETHGYYVVAVDGAGNESAPSNVVEVSLTGGRTGGGKRGH